MFFLPEKMIIAYSILSGLTAFVFIALLCQPYEVFEWWEKGVRLFLFGRQKAGNQWYIRQLTFDQMSFFQLAIYKPLAVCPKCCAGWVSILVYLSNFEFEPFTMLFFIVGSIFTAWVLTALKSKFDLEV